eukprot:c2759_g1_i1 orf=43-1806(+)
MQCAMELSREGSLELLHAIAAFLRTHQALWSAHVVEFFQDRLWEDVDIHWWNDLECASIQDLLWLPSGKVQDTWCASLKDFVRTAQSLALFRQPGGKLEKIFPGFCKPNINSVLRQGMNAKKLHEVEILSAVVNRLSEAAHATHIVDVGAGQGYLAQVLAFEYGLSVVALDACAHHADVTNKRSGRIEKYYKACSKKANQGLDPRDCIDVNGPQTATFRVMSGDSQMELQHFLSSLVPERLSSSPMEAAHTRGMQYASCLSEKLGVTEQSGLSEPSERAEHSFVLAGLHACGDLSATMLKTYMMCKEVKAVVTVGCCYNLLSENNDDEHSSGSIFGFPLSEGAKNIGLTLGRRARDLACQSAERWKDVGKESAIYNFEQHALRSAFQLVLHKYHPVLAKCNPTIGRLGKARRRKQAKRTASVNASNNVNMGGKHDSDEALSSSNAGNLIPLPKGNSSNCYEDIIMQTESLTVKDLDGNSKREKFIEFACAAFKRLGLECVAEVDLTAVWNEIEPKTVLIGPYWSLRAVLGPVLETYILLDRLLYLQEQLHHEATGGDLLQAVPEPKLIALFDPDMSPRNMAIMALKS